MNHLRYITACVILLGATTVHASAIRLCVIGDSITEGFAPSTYGWPINLRRLHANEDFGIKNVANSGDTVALQQIVFDKDILIVHGCTHVAFLIGTNDLASGAASATVYAGIDAMMDQAEAMGADTIGLSILPRGTGPSFTSNLETRRKEVNALLAARTSSVAGIRYVYVDSSGAVEGTCSTTPFASAWASSTAYSVGNVRVANSRAYIVTTAGTSAASGGPTGTGTGIVDGTVVWDYAPALSSAAGGATDGLHPSNAGQVLIANAVEAAVVAAGGW